MAAGSTRSVHRMLYAPLLTLSATMLRMIHLRAAVHLPLKKSGILNMPVSTLKPFLKSPLSKIKMQSMNMINFSNNLWNCWLMQMCLANKKERAKIITGSNKSIFWNTLLYENTTHLLFSFFTLKKHSMIVNFGRFFIHFCNLPLQKLIRRSGTRFSISHSCTPKSISPWNAAASSPKY